jgi:hypothetical protein
MAMKKDGATVRLESARDNRASQKKKTEREVNYKALRDKIEVGSAVNRMTESAGWEYLQGWIINVFSFRELMRIRKDDKGELDDKMVKGAAFADMQDWCQKKILAGTEATKILNELEAQKE